MTLTDARIQHLLMEDPREAKQAVWMQDNIRGLRQALRDTLEQLALAKAERPLEGSEAWLECGVDDGSDTGQWIGLGKRPRIRIPIGEERRPNGMPKHYIDVEPGREHKYSMGKYEPQPVSHVTVRVDRDYLCVPAGSASNVINVWPWERG